MAHKNTNKKTQRVAQKERKEEKRSLNPTDESPHNPNKNRQTDQEPRPSTIVHKLPQEEHPYKGPRQCPTSGLLTRTITRVRMKLVPH